MRITGGKYNSRTVLCPKGVIRPAMDRMRVSLFSILGNDLGGMSFLDLFSGSGLMAIEALSRGAVSADLVEKDYGKKVTILKNLSFVEEEHNLFVMDVKRFVGKFAGRKQYDIIYMDPPFPLGGKVETLNSVLQAGLLKSGGLLIIHYPEEEDDEFAKVDKAVNLEDYREYGRSHLRFYRKVE